MSWGLAVFLARRSDKVASNDAKTAVDLAELAVAIARDLVQDQGAESQWGPILLFLALSYLGNAKRVMGDLPAARIAFKDAEAWKGAATVAGSILKFEPEILSLQVSMKLAERDFPESLLLLDKIVHLYLESPDTRDAHLAGQALIQEALALTEMGKLEQVTSTLQRAETLIDPKRDRRLLFVLHHNLMENLTKQCRFVEAERQLSYVKELVPSQGSRLDRIRVRWVEARIKIGLGDCRTGRLLLEEVRQSFLAEGIAYDVALATLDLAALSLEEGKTKEAKDLASELVTIFSAQGGDLHTMAALLTLQRATAREMATVALVRNVAKVLERVCKEGPAAKEGPAPTLSIDSSV